MAKPTPLPKLRPATSVRRAAPAVIAARVADVQRPEEAVASRVDFDAVHDMRVAARRLRAALKAFKVDSGVGDEVKRLQDALGEVRDLQVQAKWLERAGHSGGAADRAIAGRTRKDLLAELPDAEKRLQRAIGRWKRVTLPSVLREADAVDSGKTLGGHRFQKLAHKRLSQIEEGFRAFKKSPDPKVAHQLRITVKKLRYQIEILAPLWPKAARRLLDRLTPLQQALGDLHDADVRLSLLKRRAGRPRGAGGHLPRLIERVQTARDKLADEVRHQIRAWEKEISKHEVQRDFSR
jgi:CHAD domain-containing protein